MMTLDMSLKRSRYKNEQWKRSMFKLIGNASCVPLKVSKWIIHYLFLGGACKINIQRFMKKIWLVTQVKKLKAIVYFAKNNISLLVFPILMLGVNNDTTVLKEQINPSVFRPWIQSRFIKLDLFVLAAYEPRWVSVTRNWQNKVVFLVWVE